MNEVSQVQLLSKSEARELTDKIKDSVESVYNLLLEAHEREAWSALGHKTWESYVKAEFQMSRRRSYQLLDFAKVERNLCNFLHKPYEAQAAPLTKLSTPAEQQQAWSRATEIAKEQGKEAPTAKHVEAAVEEVKAAQSEAPKKDAPLPKYIPCDGLQYAAQAISDLSKIHHNDTQREAAFTKVINWINNNR